MSWRVVAVSCALVALALPVRAEEEAGEAGVAPVATGSPAAVEEGLFWPPRSRPLGGGWSLLPVPGSDLYPRYVADPRRPRFSFHHMRLFDTEVVDGGESRVGVMLGGRYGFLRLHPDDDPDLGFQLDIEAAFHGQFDLGSSLDNLGWEGFYGLGISWRPVHGLAFRLSANHDSSHLGDEYMEDNPERERINYTREELALGISWEPLERLRLYAELGWAYHRGNNRLLKRGRVQAGAEYETAPILWRDGSLYLAIDAVAWEENGWEPSITVQAGAKWRVDALDREFRIGVQYYDGRSLIGEFYRDRERYLATGIWFDL